MWSFGKGGEEWRRCWQRPRLAGLTSLLRAGVLGLHVKLLPPSDMAPNRHGVCAREVSGGCAREVSGDVTYAHREGNSGDATTPQLISYIRLRVRKCLMRCNNINAKRESWATATGHGAAAHSTCRGVQLVPQAQRLDRGHGARLGSTNGRGARPKRVARHCWI